MAEPKTIFQYLKQYNLLSNPVKTELGKQLWHFRLDEIPKVKEIENLKVRLSKASSEDVLVNAYTINGATVLIDTIECEDPNALRQSAEMIKDKLGSSVVLLASIIGDRVSLVCFVSKDLVKKGLNAGKIVSAAARIAGGGGGGRPDMAQAGARDSSKLEEAFQVAREEIGSYFY